MLTGFTDTIQVPFFEESVVDAAGDVTVPGERAETRPELLTVAMAVLPALQDTPCGAPEGETEAESCFVLPALTRCAVGAYGDAGGRHHVYAEGKGTGNGSTCPFNL